MPHMARKVHVFQLLMGSHQSKSKLKIAESYSRSEQFPDLHFPTKKGEHSPEGTSRTAYSRSGLTGVQTHFPTFHFPECLRDRHFPHIPGHFLISQFPEALRARGSPRAKEHFPERTISRRPGPAYRNLEQSPEGTFRGGEQVNSQSSLPGRRKKISITRACCL